MTLRGHGEALLTSSQNLIEAWNVATRPIEKNGLGYSPTEADHLMTSLELGFPRLVDPADAFDRWRRLVVKFKVSGVQVHDARIVATMQSHGLDRILTFNSRDFERYQSIGIVAVRPEDI